MVEQIRLLQAEIRDALAAITEVYQQIDNLDQADFEAFLDFLEQLAQADT